MEKYTACNYAYFLNRALGLIEPLKKEFDAILVGETLHKIMEKALKESAFKKDYVNELNGQEVLDELKISLDNIYPRKEAEINALIMRIKKTLDRELPFLSDMEKHTLFTPIASEYHFDDVFFKFEDIELHLRGSIDRVDHYLDYFRILDYKTSKQNLRLPDLLCGHKLQLVTYAYIYHKISKRKPALVAYLNIHHETNNDNDYSFSLRNGLCLNEKTLGKDAYMFDHRLRGLFFSWLDEFDDDLRHNAVKKKEVIAFEKVAAALEDIFSYIISKLKQGKIDIAPDEKECDYCPYHSICHFRGQKGLEKEAITTIKEGMEDET